MPLPELQLDDRRFSELTAFLRDQIPGLTRKWTDFNPSDPGITLIELWSWLAEMVLYRINQVSRRSYDQFFKLLLDPPEAVTAEVTMEVVPQLGPPSVAIPPGTRFDAALGSPPPGLIFETFRPVPVPMITVLSPPALAQHPSISFPVRSVVEVRNEFLGVSTGEPDQMFPLRSGPVLIDEENIGVGPGDYNPNPRVTVDGVSWQFTPDFLETTTTAVSTQFMVEGFTRSIRFGNGTQGMIPPRGARIAAERYQILLGAEVRIGADSLVLLDPIPGLASSDILSIHNAPAEGGNYLYPPEQAATTGLRLFHEEFRAIKPEDFEEILRTQFNRNQDSIPAPVGASGRISRVGIVPGKRVQGLPPFADVTGGISVIVLPERSFPAEVQLQPSNDLLQRVSRFLDRRRLVTTRVFVAGPRYVPVSLDIRFTAEPRTNISVVKTEIENGVRRFMDPLTGGDDGEGWPFGRSVYRSEIFQIVESVKGVDHANSVTLNGNAALQSVTLSDNELPLPAAISLST